MRPFVYFEKKKKKTKKKKGGRRGLPLKYFLYTTSLTIICYVQENINMKLDAQTIGYIRQ